MNWEFLILLSFISPLESCLVVRRSDEDLVKLPNCQCPPFTLTSQEGVRKNPGGRYLANRQTWFPVIGLEEPQCGFSILCPGVPGVTSFYTTMFRSNGSPIFINRVIDNQSTDNTQPRILDDLKCQQHKDGSYQWFFNDYPVYDILFACQADVESCNCPPISVNDEGKYEYFKEFPEAPKQCSLYSAFEFAEEDETTIRAPLVYSNKRAITPGDMGYSTFEDLMCIKADDNTFSWYFFNEKLDNVSIGWNTIPAEYGSEVVCQCGAFPAIRSTEVLPMYDKTNQFKGKILGASPWIASCNFYLTCDEGFDAVVFSDNNEPIIVNEIGNRIGDDLISCVTNPMNRMMTMWVVKSNRLINPAGACLKTPDSNELPLPNCQCAPFQLLNQEEVRANIGGHYLGNRQTWSPEINYNSQYPCYFNLFCHSVPGVSSFYTIMLRSNGNPIYINRVVDNQSTFIDQPREIGDFKCALHTDGTYQWLFHNYSLTDVAFVCQADVDSCNCPEIKVDTNSGATATTRYSGAPNQCSLFDAECTNSSQRALLYSKDTTIMTGSIYKEDFYEDLMCIKEDDNNFNWYFSNKKLENVTIGCNSYLEEFGVKITCYCGGFPIIDTDQKLTKHDKTQKYTGATVGLTGLSWISTPSCKFNLLCDQGFTGVVFSDNSDPIELTGNYITCIYNPLNNGLRIWVVNSYRMINPVGGCLKKT